MRNFIVPALAGLSLVGSLSAVHAAQVRSVNVTGSLTSGGAAGSFLNITCTPRNGVLTGSGTLYGVNPQNGYRYSYPLAITGSRTATNTLVLTGKYAGNLPFTLTTHTPSGPLSFVYTLANGRSVTSSGKGTVITR